MGWSIRKNWKAWVITAVGFSAVLFGVVHYLIEKSEAFEVASSFLRSNPDVIRVAGAVRETSLSWDGGEIETSGEGGSAKLTVNVTGVAGSPKAYVELKKRGIWEVTFARLLPASGAPVLLKDGK